MQSLKIKSILSFGLFSLVLSLICVQSVYAADNSCACAINFTNPPCINNVDRQKISYFPLDRTVTFSELFTLLGLPIECPGIIGGIRPNDYNSSISQISPDVCVTILGTALQTFSGLATSCSLSSMNPEGNIGTPVAPTPVVPVVPAADPAATPAVPATSPSTASGVECTTDAECDWVGDVCENGFCYAPANAPVASAVSPAPAATPSTPSTPAASGPQTVPLPNPLLEDIKDVPTLIGMIIKAALSVVGALSLLMFVYGGFTWLTSAGNQERVGKGTKTMLWAVIGLIVVFASYMLVSQLFKGLSV